jgi:hypothetical protein
VADGNRLSRGCQQTARCRQQNRRKPPHVIDSVSNLINSVAPNQYT